VTSRERAVVEAKKLGLDEGQAGLAAHGKKLSTHGKKLGGK